MQGLFRFWPAGRKEAFMSDSYQPIYDAIRSRIGGCDVGQPWKWQSAQHSTMPGT